MAQGKGGNSVRQVREESQAFVSIVSIQTDFTVASAVQRLCLCGCTRLTHTPHVACTHTQVKADFRHVQERIMILKGTVEQIAAATKGIALLSVFR